MATTPAPEPAAAARAPWLALVLLIVLGAMWGAMLGLGRVAIDDGVPGLAFAFWQCVGGAVGLGVIAAARRAAPPLDRRHLRYYAISSLVSNAIPNALAFTVLAYIGAGLTAVMYTLSPLFTYGVARLVGIERFYALRMLGVALGLAGALMIVLPSSSLPTPDMAWWALLGMAIPAVLGFGNVYRAWAWPAGASSLSLAVGMLTAAAIWLAPALVVADAVYIPFPPAHDGDWATIAIIVLGSAMYALYFQLLRMAGPVFFSQISYVIAASGVVIGVVAFDERHSIWVWLAIAVICLGVLLVNRRRV